MRDRHFASGMAVGLIFAALAVGVAVYATDVKRKREKCTDAGGVTTSIGCVDPGVFR